MPSPEVITETHDGADGDDPFSRSFGRVGTRTRSLSVAKLEEMAARATAETEAKVRAQKKGREAAVDKTLPVPPVPSGKPSGYGANGRVFAQDIFQQSEPEETAGGAEAEAGAEIIPHMSSLSGLSLLRPPPRRDVLAFPSYGDQGNEESGLDALERRLVEEVGTRKPLPLPPPDLRTVLDLGSASPLPPPPPVPVPVPVPGKKPKSMAQAQADDVDTGAAVNESAISSLALGAKEDFGGRNANPNTNLALPDVQIEGEEEAEGDDPDADGRTQRHGKGAGASSGSERGTYKARSRKSAKSDKDRERVRARSKSKDGRAKRKKKRDGRREERDDEAARFRSAAKGRVAEWLGKLEAYEPGPGSSPSPPGPEQETETTPQTEATTSIASATATAATSTASSPTVPPPVVESKPNPRSSGFVPVSTLRRAPISLPPEASSTPTPASASVAHLHGLPTSSTAVAPNAIGLPAPVPIRRVGHVYPPPSQVEVKYDVKSARGGRGGRVTAAVASASTEAGEGFATSSGKWCQGCADQNSQPGADQADDVHRKPRTRIAGSCSEAAVVCTSKRKGERERGFSSPARSVRIWIGCSGSSHAFLTRALFLNRDSRTIIDRISRTTASLHTHHNHDHDHRTARNE